MMNIFFLLILLLVPLAIFSFFYFWLKRQRHSTRQRGGFAGTRPAIDLKDLKKVQRDNSVSSQTKKKLIRILNGDEAAARRLIESEKARHPGRSENWYWEKVIYNLERDR